MQSPEAYSNGAAHGAGRAGVAVLDGALEVDTVEVLVVHVEVDVGAVVVDEDEGRCGMQPSPPANTLATNASKDRKVAFLP